MAGISNRFLIVSGVLFFCTFISHAQDPVVRFFFDTKGAGETEDRTIAGADVLSFANPVSDGSYGQTFRYYLYGQFLGATQTWVGIDLNICVSGPGQIVTWNIYNALTTSGQRWNSVHNKTGSNVTCVLSTRTPAIFTPGMFNTSFATTIDTLHFRLPSQDGGSPHGTTLLGYVDVMRFNAPNDDPVEVFLEVGPFGIARIGGGPADWIAFGFGDAPVQAGDDNERSVAADATITSTCNACDINCDGSVNPFDISPFLDILFNVTLGCSYCAGDTNEDGSINPFDIQPFLDCLQ